MNGFDRLLLSRVEDAGLNASAPPQQRWSDGWLLRLSPGKARRARCINAVAVGLGDVPTQLERARRAYAAAGLPLIVRITPFTQPAGLDAELAARGWDVVDDTRVLVRTAAADRGAATADGDGSPPPAGLHWQALGAEAYAESVGLLRGSPPEQRRAHAERLRHSPVPYHGFALCSDDGEVQACGQVAVEDDLAGLYDVFTRGSRRGSGLATYICERLLSVSSRLGADTHYLQVEGDNDVARRLYARLGFAEAYRYHYRMAPPAG